MFLKACAAVTAVSTLFIAVFCVWFVRRSAMDDADSKKLDEFLHTTEAEMKLEREAINRQLNPPAKLRHLVR